MSGPAAIHPHLVQGRDAFGRRAWAEACAGLAAADRAAPLPPEDVERLAVATLLVGRESESAELWVRAHREFLASGAPARAARCAFWLAFGLLERGHSAQCAGWVARTRRLLEEVGRESVELGYCALLEGMRLVGEGEYGGALDAFTHAATDLDRLQSAMGEQWEAIAGYSLDCARRPATRAAVHRLMEHFGFPALPSEVLARIEVPTALIWGRHDLATSLAVAEQASARYGWALHIVEDAGDDPPLEQPDRFVTALRAALAPAELSHRSDRVTAKS